MFPIRDHNPSQSVPFVTYALMALNILIFGFTWLSFPNGAGLGQFYLDWAIIPRLITSGQGYSALLTSIFLHAGLLHLAGNMLFLWVFGDNLEHEWGHFPFLLFYLTAGVAAGLLQVISEPFSIVPTIGASGAIAGVMGGYLLLFPKAKVDIFIFFVVFFRIIPVPAWIMLGLWMVMQLFGGFGPGDESVAYFAHIGGFAVGMALTVPLWIRRGGTGFWSRSEGHPPHPEAIYARSRIPVVRRNR